jgi:hypothetical protein
VLRLQDYEQNWPYSWMKVSEAIRWMRISSSLLRLQDYG